VVFFPIAKNQDTHHLASLHHSISLHFAHQYNQTNHHLTIAASALTEHYHTFAIVVYITPVDWAKRLEAACGGKNSKNGSLWEIKAPTGVMERITTQRPTAASRPLSFLRTTHYVITSLLHVLSTEIL
jgi:hypothetical protein